MSVGPEYAPEGLNRRTFLLGVLMGTTAVAVGGCGGSEGQSRPEPETSEMHEEASEAGSKEMVVGAYELWSGLEKRIEQLSGPVARGTHAQHHILDMQHIKEQGGGIAGIATSYEAAPGADTPVNVQILVEYTDDLDSQGESDLWVHVDCGANIETAEDSAWLAGSWHITEEDARQRIADGEADIAFILELVARTQPLMLRAGEVSGKQMAMLRDGSDVFGLRVAANDEAMARSDEPFAEPTEELLGEAKRIAASANDEIIRLTKS